MGSFTMDLDRFAAKTEARINIVARKIGIGIFTKVIIKTPVDTGRARANWQSSVGAPAVSEVDDEDPSGSKAVAAAVATCNQWIPMGSLPVVLANNLPYIQRLEDGYSQQAPAGMVAVTMAEYAGIVEEAVQ